MSNIHDEEKNKRFEELSKKFKSDEKLSLDELLEYADGLAERDPAPLNENPNDDGSGSGTEAVLSPPTPEEIRKKEEEKKAKELAEKRRADEELAARNTAKTMEEQERIREARRKLDEMLRKVETEPEEGPDPGEGFEPDM